MLDLNLELFWIQDDLIIQKKTQYADCKFCKTILILDPEQPSFVSYFKSSFEKLFIFVIFIKIIILIWPKILRHQSL